MAAPSPKKPRAARTTVKPKPPPPTVNGKPVGPPSDGEFHYRNRFGEDIRLHSLATLEQTFGMARALSEDNKQSLFVQMITAAVLDKIEPDTTGLPSSPTLRAVDHMTWAEIDEMFDRWGEFSGISGPNSQAS